MGAALSTDDHPLAVAAVAEITQFDLEQLRALCLNCRGAGGALEYREGDDDNARDELEDSQDQGYIEDATHRRADLEHPPDLSWTSFQHALDKAKFVASDRAILERMFTLMDKTGDELVSRRELLVGACVLLQGELTDKMQAAVEIHQLTGRATHGRRASISGATSRPSYNALLFILSTFVTVASFFGDPLLKKTALAKAVHDVLDSPEGSFADNKIGSSAMTLQHLARHPVVDQYVHQLAVDAEAHDAA